MWEKDRMQSPPLAYDVGAALGYSSRSRHQAILAMFRHESHDVWLPRLAQSAAYDYWSMRIHNNGVLAVAGHAPLHGAVTLLAECLYLGWMDESRALALLIRILYGKHRFNLDHAGFTYPLSHWLLRICLDYWNLEFDGWGDFGKSPAKDKYQKGQCFGEPVLNDVFAHWRDPDLAPFDGQLHWLCDYYTHRTRPGEAEHTEFRNDFLHTRFPGAILAWFRLRESLGLANPVIDHPLMKPAYTQLYLPRPFYTDDQLNKVLARLRREEIPDLGSLTQVDVGTWSPKPAQGPEQAVKGATILEPRRRPKPFWNIFSKRK
jgi:hypothetical protein